MKHAFLFLHLLGSLAISSDSDTKELFLNCRSGVTLAQELSKNNFDPSLWRFGDVLTKDAGYVDVLLADEAPALASLRQVFVAKSPLFSPQNQSPWNEISFSVQGRPFLKDAITHGGGSFGYVELEQWRWHNISGSLVFQLLPGDGKGERVIGMPCKLPKSWMPIFNPAASLRNERARWFSPGLTDLDINKMRENITANNPLWRLCITQRLIELGRLREADVKIALETATAQTLELGCMLVILFNDKSPHESAIMECVRRAEHDQKRAEGLALGCLTSAAGRPRSIERAFESLDLLNQLKKKASDPMEDKEKMIDGIFSKDADIEYRVGHKLHALAGGLNKDLKQKISDILSYMLTP
ncbi:hypothetical protein [Prosthecobacter sp.]|uniref:hypothetical protein n=1 Tax=Prosthecobacter sp. TaxID=1965333 RepID=UPI0037849B53